MENIKSTFSLNGLSVKNYKKTKTFKNKRFKKIIFSRNKKLFPCHLFVDDEIKL